MWRQAYVKHGKKKNPKKISAGLQWFTDLAYNSHLYTFPAIPKVRTAPSSFIHVTFPCFCPVFVLASGLQAILPEYLRARFVQAALSYIACNEEGQFVCRDNDCWCQCAVDYPQCNCPKVDLRAMEASVLEIQDSWNRANQDFEESGQCVFFLHSFNGCDTSHWQKIRPYC